MTACSGGYHDTVLQADFDPSFAADAKIVVTITNTLDENAPNESIAYGDLALTKCAHGYDLVTQSCCSAYACNWHDYWTDVSCTFSEHECDGYTLYGWRNCAVGTSFYGEYDATDWDETTDKVIFTGKIWTVDTWDNEWIKVQILDGSGNEIASK